MAIYSRMKEPDECQDWISCLRLGDEKALEHFFEEHNRGIYHYVKGIVQMATDTEDIVQESFMSLWRFRVTIQNELHLRNFLYKVATHRSIHCLRLRSKESLLRNEIVYSSSASSESSVATAVSGREAEMISSRVLELLFHYIAELPPGCKEVFMLSYFDKKSTKQIAEQLEIAPQTVLNQKTRARNKLKELFLRQELSPFLLLLLSIAAGY